MLFKVKGEPATQRPLPEPTLRNHRVVTRHMNNNDLEMFKFTVKEMRMMFDMMWRDARVKLCSGLTEALYRHGWPNESFLKLTGYPIASTRLFHEVTMRRHDEIDHPVVVIK